MARDTKQRIIEAALSNFNELGYANVRLQDIATVANMSVGNMAYHFKHKAELFETIYKDWQQQQTFLLADIHLTPIFENFDTFLEQTFKLQRKFRFLYLDQLELVRMSEPIKIGFQAYFQNQKEQLEILLELYKARGVIDYKTTSANFLALKIQRGMDNWLRQQIIEGKSVTDFPLFRQYIWSELVPFLTENGQAEHKERLVLESK